MVPRRASEADRPRLTALLAELAREHGQAGDAAMAARVLTEPLGRAGPFLFVADQDEALVGFAALIGHFPARDFTWGLTMTDLFVSAPHRARGVGRILLAACCRFARQAGYTRIDNSVRQDEALPRQFYRSLGLAPASRHIYRLEGEMLERLPDGARE